MSQTLMLTDTLYARLEATARRRGLPSIERLIEVWQAQDDELLQQQEVIRRIDALRERLFATYGAMADSVDLLREERSR